MTAPILYLAGRTDSEREARAARIDNLAPDRLMFQIDRAGWERKLKPLAPAEQAFKDRCDEKVRAAKADERIGLYEVRKRLAGRGKVAHGKFQGER